MGEAGGRRVPEARWRLPVSASWCGRGPSACEEEEEEERGVGRPRGELAPEAYLCLLLEMGVGRRRPRE